MRFFDTNTFILDCSLIQFCQYQFSFSVQYFHTVSYTHLVFALSSSIELAKEVVSELGIPLGLCDVKHFADGEIMVELGESVRGKHVYIIQSTCNPVSTNLMEVLLSLIHI